VDVSYTVTRDSSGSDGFSRARSRLRSVRWWVLQAGDVVQTRLMKFGMQRRPAAIQAFNVEAVVVFGRDPGMQAHLEAVAVHAPAFVTRRHVGQPVPASNR